MSETKLREFNRSSCEKILMEAIKRARDINRNKGRKKYLCYVDRLTVFGSLINSSKEKIHDVDLYVSVWFIGKFDSQACYDYSEKYGPESLMYRGWYRIVDGTELLNFLEAMFTEQSKPGVSFYLFILNLWNECYRKMDYTLMLFGTTNFKRLNTMLSRDTWPASVQLVTHT